MSGHLVRQQITLPPGTTQVPHQIPIQDPALIMVLPLAPLDSWANISIVGQPGYSTVGLLNQGQTVTINVAFYVPPEYLSPARTDNY